MDESIPKIQVSFTGRDLKNLIIPMFMEQFLLALTGIVDTFVVSYAGEADVSGVSLVNSFNTVFIFLSTALSIGGAVIINQYIGIGHKKLAARSAGQLLTFSFISSVILSVLILLLNRPLLQFLFGRVEPDVMTACVTYLRISAYSFPALAVYNSGAALCRSTGKAQITMYISAAANIVNIIGDLIGVFCLHSGVAGVAYPSLLSRTIMAVAVTAYCAGRSQDIRYCRQDVLTWDAPLLGRILRVAVPNGIENGVHQLVKVALSSMAALFGTCQIAANGVAQSIWSLAALMGLAMAPVYTTVIGQCMGARDLQAADFYFRKLTKIGFVLSIAWNALIFALTPLFLHLYRLSSETASLVLILVLINNIFNGIAYPFAGPLGNGLRAAGDIRFTMIVSVSLTIFARLFFSGLFGVRLNMGVIGIAFGMSIDLVIRGLIFIQRFRSGKWQQFHLI
ncbi:MAG: MATE family efflux transporter [Butyrivibrio sp.]|jgi:putative MATE family efflux protein|nr:MATE family efflux transporter [Butyrivibrio sp.]